MTKSPCQRERQRYQGWESQNSVDYLPECADDGSYKPVQCNSSHCWCVDSHGYELPETQTLTSEDLNCSKVPGIVINLNNFASLRLLKFIYGFS